jgi:hypothetical protein
MTDKEWIQRAIPFLESKLWTLSEILIAPLIVDDGFSDAIIEEIKKDHKELTELLAHVDRL